MLLLPSKAAAAAQRPAPGGAGEVVRFFWSGESGVRGGASRESESCRRFLLLSPQFNPVPAPSASARLLLLLPCARCPADERRRQEEEEAPLLLLLRCHRAFSEAIDFCFFLIFHSSEKLEDWGVQRVSSRSSTRSLARARARASPVPTSSELCTYQPGARCNKKAGERERERWLQVRWLQAIGLFDQRKQNVVRESLSLPFFCLSFQSPRYRKQTVP